jgi:hypothetical protein
LPEARSTVDILFERPTISAFSERISFLGQMAGEIADVAVFRAAFAGSDRDIVLRSVTRRLQAELEGK